MCVVSLLPSPCKVACGSGDEPLAHLIFAFIPHRRDLDDCVVRACLENVGRPMGVCHKYPVGCRCFFEKPGTVWE